MFEQSERFLSTIYKRAVFMHHTNLDFLVLDLHLILHSTI